MMKKSLLIGSVLLLSACVNVDTQGNNASSSSDGMMDHGMEESSAAMSDAAMDRLVNSPRHQEWVEVENDEKTIYTWVVYPERNTPAPVVMLIHENRGLTDWVRSMADQVAEAGYIAVAPDLLSGFSGEYERTSDFPDEDAAINAIYQLSPEQVASDLQAVADYAETIPAGNGNLASAGFCWGGSQSFAFATQHDDLDAALVFYGTGPEDESVYANIDAPVFGFYGGNDDRVNATIEQSEEYMTDAGKEYHTTVYDGAGHAFMRLGEGADADAANKQARDEAWERMNEILAGLE